MLVKLVPDFLVVIIVWVCGTDVHFYICIIKQQHFEHFMAFEFKFTYLQLSRKCLNTKQMPILGITC